MILTNNFEELIANLPEGWLFTHLLALEPEGFQCNLASEDFVVIGTGDTPTGAVYAAIEHTGSSIHYMTRYKPEDHTAIELAPLRTSLDIAKLFLRREPINRRL